MKISKEELEKLADEYAFNKVKNDVEQGVQMLECCSCSLASSRGDYLFQAVSFGLGTNRFETLISSSFLKVRMGGQGREGLKHPVLFPKLSFFYDEELHGDGKTLEWLFDEAVLCSSKTMYPDFISLSQKNNGYATEIYKKYGVAISRMGCVRGSSKIKLMIGKEDEIKEYSFREAWNILSEKFDVKDQKNLGFDNGEYIDLEDVKIVDCYNLADCYRIIKNKNDSNWLKINFVSGEEFVCTEDHPFFCNGELKQANKLVEGDECTLIKKGVLPILGIIKTIEKLNIVEDSYDVTTSTEYFVCDELRSHNCRANLSPWFKYGGIKPENDLYEVEYEDGTKELLKKEDIENFECLQEK